MLFFFFFQAEDGIRDYKVTGVQTCALPISALIDDISTKAKVRGVTIGRIEPQPVDPGPPFDTYRYRLEIIGHYDQLGEFLSDIASLRRIIVPQDVVLKAAAGPPAAKKGAGER